MQRQSLGGGGSSPGSKHHNLHGAGVSSSSSSSKEVLSSLFNGEAEEEKEAKEETSTIRKERGVVVVSEIEEEVVVEKKKKNKHHRHHHHHLRSRTEKSIHLIPILTISCLLILYLCSYDPPLKDLAHIDGFRRISKRTDSTTMTTEIKNNSGLERFSSELDDDDQNNKAVIGDVLLLPLRSHRSLHEIRRKDGKKSKSHRFHRKIGEEY